MSDIQTRFIVTDATKAFPESDGNTVKTCRYYMVRHELTGIVSTWKAPFELIKDVSYSIHNVHNDVAKMQRKMNPAYGFAFYIVGKPESLVTTTDYHLDHGNDAEVIRHYLSLIGH